MNRIETRIIIMVTNRLARAKESDAKTEMIEELSENLYQRFLELTAEGMSEDEALKKAMESLGDVEELLAYLEEVEAESRAASQTGSGQTAERTDAAKASGKAADEVSQNDCRQDGAMQDEKPQEDRNQEDDTWEESCQSGGRTDGGRDSYRGGSGSFFNMDGLENGLEEIVNAAFSTAKVAMDCARDVAKDVSDQIKEKYPDGVFVDFSLSRGKKVDCTEILPDSVHSLDVRLTNGSIVLRCAKEEDAFIEVTGDTEEIETMLKDDGVLSISQGNTASASYFFMRGMRRSDLSVVLPKKLWNSITISTVNGDICMADELECGQLQASAHSGDLNLEHIVCSSMTLKSGSGDIIARELKGDLHAETKSGDILVSGMLGCCELFSASGDISFEGSSIELNSSSTSGDVGLKLACVPEKLKGNSISGDCRIRVPAQDGFHLSYRTVSGDFHTNLPLTGTLGEKRGDVMYGDGVGREIQLSSVSGDISICASDTGE